jgi:hypothetical protein
VETDISLPYLNINDDVSLFMADKEQRFRLVGKVFENEGHTLDEVPEAWKDGPLSAWCWLVLTINNIEFDPEDKKPLVAYGIDLGFSSADIRRWTFTIA